MNVPWHQDNAYMSEEAWNNLTVVAWIPLVDANENNGCMQVLEQGHRWDQTISCVLVTDLCLMWYQCTNITINLRVAMQMFHIIFTVICTGNAVIHTVISCHLGRMSC